MSIKRKLLYLAVSAALLPNSAAQADDAIPAAATTVAENTETPTPATLQPVEVISAASVGRGSNVEKMDISTTVITRQQIQDSAELTVDQILNRQMGILTSNALPGQSDPTGSNLQMRGFGQNGVKVLVTVDGVPMNDAMFRTIDWNQIPKDTIEKIEIIRGGGGAAMWGNLAEGGVINIVSREPVKDEKRAGAAYGSFNTVVGDLAGTVYHSDDVKVGANFNAISSAGYNQSPVAFQNNKNLTAEGNRTNNGLISTYYTPNDYTKFFAKFSGFEQLQDQGAGGISIGTGQLYKYDYRGGGEIKFSKTGSLNTSSFYNHSEMDRTNGSLYVPTGDTSLSNLNPNTYINSQAYVTQYESIQYQQYGLSGFIKEEMHDWWGDVKDIKLGFDARGANTHDNNTIYNSPIAASTDTVNTHGVVTAPNPGGPSSIFGNVRTSATNAYEGLFAQATFSPKDTPLDVTLGLREDFWQAFDANGATGAPVVNGVAGTHANPGTLGNQVSLTPSKTPSQGFYQFNPRLGLKYSFNSGIDLRGAVYRNYAAPGMNQLYRSYYGSGSASLSNADLSPETNFGQEVGLDFTNNTVKVKTTAYHNELANYVQSVQMCSGCSAAQAAAFGVPVTATTISQNQNIGTASFQGGEAFFDWQPLSTLDLNASVVRTWATLESYTGAFETINKTLSATSAVYLNRQLPSVQPWTITLGGKWDFYQDLSVGWSIKSWPAYWTATAASTNANQQNTAATTADMHFNYKANKHVDLYINAQNISNAYYITTNAGSSGSTVPTIGMPRNIMGGFKFVW